MFRRCLVLFSVLCIEAALLPLAAMAHDPTTTTTEVKKKESYQVQAGTERIIIGYKNGKQTGTERVVTGSTKVRVAPFRKMVPNYDYRDVPQYEDVVTRKFVGNKKERVPPYSQYVDVYNYKTICLPIGCRKVRVAPFRKVVPNYDYRDVPQYEDVVTRKFVGNKKERVPPYSQYVDVYNYEDQPIYGTRPVYERIPVYKDQPTYETRYRMVGTGEYTTSTTHTAHACPAGYYAPPLPNPMWINITTGHTTTNLDSVGSRILYELAVWEKQDDTHDCHKPKLKTANSVDPITAVKTIVVNGSKYVVKGGKVVIDKVEYAVEKGQLVLKVAANKVLSAAERAAKEAVEVAIADLKATHKWLKENLCSYEGQVGITIALGILNQYKANQQVIGTILTAAAVSSNWVAVITVGLAIGIITYCTFAPDPKGASAADDGGETEAADDGGETEAADDGGETEAADDGGETEAADDGGETEAADDGGETDNSGSPTENYDISDTRYLQWLSEDKFPSYENGPGCTSWGPGISTGRLVYQCPDN